MINVNVNTSSVRKNTTTELISTPMTIINEMELGLSGASVNLNGFNLSVADLSTTFADLKVRNGETVFLNIVVKADGGTK